MSSKGRKDGKKSEAQDFYPTPEAVTVDFLKRWKAVAGPLPGGVWVEPAVGDGAIVRAVGAVQDRDPIDWRSCDVRPIAGVPETGSGTLAKGWKHHLGDFLAVRRGVDPWAVTVEDAAVAITNPPFTYAEAFVRQCRALCPKAWVVMLLRLGMLEADERVPFWQTFGDVDVFPIVPRPSFGVNKHGKAGTDSAAYGWMVWTPPSAVELGAPSGARLHFPAEPWRETLRTKRERLAREAETAKQAKADARTAAKRKIPVQYGLFDGAAKADPPGPIPAGAGRA
jgi:hypothetical protein